jgi:hypothetical protein
VILNLRWLVLKCPGRPLSRQQRSSLGDSSDSMSSGAACLSWLRSDRRLDVDRMTILNPIFEPCQIVDFDVLEIFRPVGIAFTGDGCRPGGNSWCGQAG